MKKVLLLFAILASVACSKPSGEDVDVAGDNPTTFMENNVGLYEVYAPAGHANYDDNEYLSAEITRASILSYTPAEGDYCMEVLNNNSPHIVENTPNRLRIISGDIVILTKRSYGFELYYEDSSDGCNYTLQFNRVSSINRCN